MAYNFLGMRMDNKMTKTDSNLKFENRTTLSKCFN